jgi:hypothetical protein
VEPEPTLPVEEEDADEHNIPTEVDVPETVGASPEIHEVGELGVGDVVDKDIQEVYHGNEPMLDEDTTLIHTEAPFTDLSDKFKSEEHVYETASVEADDNFTSDYIMEGDTMLNVPEGMDIILIR